MKKHSSLCSKRPSVVCVYKGKPPKPPVWGKPLASTQALFRSLQPHAHACPADGHRPSPLPSTPGMHPPVVLCPAACLLAISHPFCILQEQSHILCVFHQAPVVLHSQPRFIPLPGTTWGKGITQEFECRDTVETELNSYGMRQLRAGIFSECSQIWISVLEKPLPAPCPAQSRAKAQEAAGAQAGWPAGLRSALPAPLQLPAELGTPLLFAQASF